MKPFLYSVPFILATTALADYFGERHYGPRLHLKERYYRERPREVIIERDYEEPLRENLIHFTFKGPNGEGYPLSFYSHETIAAIRLKLEEKYHRAVKRLYLSSGIPLKNHRTFRSYALGFEDVIRVVFY